MTPVARFLALGVCLASLWACSKKIGDACRVSDDCIQDDPDRTCDLSQPSGYCTVTPCDEKSCPSDSTCVRVFPHVLVTQAATCTPGAASPGCPEGEACLPSGRCVPKEKVCDPAKAPAVSECTADEICVDNLCVPRTSERRFCAQTCGGNDDCRGSYECRVAGTLGSLPLTTKTTSRVKFCAPRPRAP